MYSIYSLIETFESSATLGLLCIQSEVHGIEVEKGEFDTHVQWKVDVLNAMFVSS